MIDLRCRDEESGWATVSLYSNYWTETESHEPSGRLRDTENIVPVNIIEKLKQLIEIENQLRPDKEGSAKWYSIASLGHTTKKIVERQFGLKYLFW